MWLERKRPGSGFYPAFFLCWGKLIYPHHYFRYRHLEEADVKTDGSCHEQVVVRTYDGTIRTIRLLLVVDVLVETTLVSLDVHVFTDNLY